MYLESTFDELEKIAVKMRINLARGVAKASKTKGITSGPKALRDALRKLHASGDFNKINIGLRD